MGSGSSKSTLNRRNSENGSTNKGSAIKLENNNTSTKRQEKSSTDIITTNTAKTDLKSTPKGEESGNGLSDGVDTDAILKSKGFDDDILSRHCKDTPEILDDLIKLYEHVQSIKDKIEAENLILALTTHLKGIKTLYATKKKFRVTKGNFLSDLGFADVFKDILDRFLPGHPNLLSLVKFGSDDDATENSLAETLLRQRTNVRNENKEVQGQDSSEDEVAKENLKKARSFLDLLFRISLNYTDLCDTMCVAFSEAGLVPVWIAMVEQLKDCTEFHLKWMDSNGHLPKKTVRGIILSSCIGTLHNLARRVQTRPRFHACNAVSVLVPFLKDPVVFFATKALFVLAYLVDESNDDLIKSKEEPIQLIISFLDKAVYSKNKRYLGFSSCEIAEGLAQIAINDNNKKLIVTNGALPVLMAMIKLAHEDEERANAANVLWVLAFDEDNRAKMTETEGLIDVLYSIKESTNQQIKKAVNGALWELEGKRNHSIEVSAKAEDLSATQPHVMISYQWDVQKTLIQVKNNLQKAGYKVWMDLEQMGGSTLEAMAGAVEDSAVVLVCVSQRYKESANCRSEAEYAFQLKKDIVPLMMDKNYQPNGWLGMVMGSKLWIDFSGKKKIDDSLKELEKQLGSRGKTSGELHTTNAVNADTAITVQSTPKIDISGWTNKDVMAWLDTLGLEIKEVHSLHKLTGTMLILLHTLRNESPDFYYASLKDDIGLLDVCSVLKFTHELEKVVT